MLTCSGIMMSHISRGENVRANELELRDGTASMRKNMSESGRNGDLLAHFVLELGINFEEELRMIYDAWGGVGLYFRLTSRSFVPVVRVVRQALNNFAYVLES